mmetsp:Transcript_29023/g.32556  ORF Transcript_29023/g.32556 Transcript_29023/m.32556 type:complete len:950 (-) Transcript_29023:713-3562(-)
MTDFLGDLNIVTIPVAQVPKLAAKRTKKKKNKYERRRQKVEKAREQLYQETSLSNEGEEECKSNQQVRNDKNSKIIRPTIDENDEENNFIKPLISVIANESTDTDVNHNTHQQNEIKNVTDYSLATVSSKIVAKSSYNSPNDIPTRSSVNAVTNTVNPTKNLRNTVSTHKHDEQERAKYMAEFHARPMELDRRSGARSATIVSRESTHIFDDAQNSSWESLNIHPRLVQTLQSPKFDLQTPTTIQSKTIRAFQESTDTSIGESERTIIEKKNILIHSETGSGKTLAYLLPILQSLSFGNQSNNKNKNEQPKKISRSEMGCRCIILCPTRELASQTLQVLELLCQANFSGWIVPGGLLGGDSRNSEKSRLRKGLAMIVATPGRLLDHLHKTQSLALSLKGKLKWLVLDEADRLLDMGLGDQIRSIVQWVWSNEACSTHQQPWWRSVLVSATVTPSVQILAKEKILCGDQEWIWVKSEERSQNSGQDTQKSIGPVIMDESGTINDSEEFAHSTPRQLAQFHITVTAKLRLSTLVSFLAQRVSKGERTVVFMGTCASVDFHYQLFNALEESLWDDDGKKDQDDDTTASIDTTLGLFGRKALVFKLHGSVPHSKRSQTMKEFSANIVSSNSDKTKLRAVILLTTDVSARGLNLKGVDWAVQYDPPCEIADYVHRVGRVARAGKAGHSLLFLLPSERKYLEVLETKGINKLTALSLSSILNQASRICKEWTHQGSIQQGDGRTGTTTTKSKQSGFIHSSRSGEHFAAEVQRRLENCIVKDDNETRKAFKESTSKEKQRKRKLTSNSKDGRKEGLLLAMARDAFLSFLRAYSTKKEAVVRSIFSSRALHFGHIARCFALKEPPKSLVSTHKSKRKQYKKEVQDGKANLPRSLEFGEVLVDRDEFYAIDKDNKNGQTDDNEETEFGFKKRKTNRQNAKAMLLENAAKMQSNLMDAM